MTDRDDVFIKQGIYDQSRQFAFTNITDNDFESKWGGSPIKVKAHQTVTLPHHLAVKLTTELVDKIMLGDLKTEHDAMRAKDPNWKAAQGAGKLGIPAVRAIWEDKILRELEIDEEKPEIQVLRAQIKDQLLADLNQEKTAPVTAVKLNQAEFADVKPKKVK
jgi:hypothetical protein